MVWWDILGFQFDEEDMKKKLKELYISLSNRHLDENNYYALAGLYYKYRKKIKRHWNKINDKVWFENKIRKINITLEKARRGYLSRQGRLRPALSR
jgi:hypothetical protein